MSEPRYYQPHLEIDVRPKREVGWIIAYEETVKKRWRFGAEVISRIDTDESGLARWQTVDADDISEIKDPNLAYALRFADAVNSIGWIKDEPDSHSSWRHMVVVQATNEGFDSRLVNASYTGLDGVFEEDLSRFGQNI